MPLIPETILNPPNCDELEVTVFGPGYGESMVLHIPGAGWGIVDSCITKAEGQSVTLPLRYLLDLLPPPYPKLAFVVLTHPHEDHYAGLDEIITKYPGGIERICRYDGDGIRELKTYICQQRVAQRWVLPGLAEVFKAMQDAVKSGAQLRRLGEMTVIFDSKNVHIQGYGHADMYMIALSPSATSVQEYVEDLFKVFPQPGKPVKPLDDKAHNKLSVALHLKVGQVQLLLGSDVEAGNQENSGWKGVLLNRDCPDLWANFVKAPHHGSESGFEIEAWKIHAGRGKPIVAVTPFCRGNVLLPRPKDVETLKGFAKNLGLTGSVACSTQLNKYYPRDVVRGIRCHARSMKIVQPTNEIGMIRVRFLLDGTETERLAVSPASWL